MTFQKIKQTYDNYYKSILKSGKLLVKDTEKGIWGISPIDEIYEFFTKINLKKYKNFLDLGSGDGKVVAIASLFTNATGIEYDKNLHQDALHLFSILKINAKLLNFDYMDQNISQYDLIFINPDKGFHHGLNEKLLRELKGDLFVFNRIFQPLLKKGRTFWAYQTPVINYKNSERKKG